MPTKRMFDLVLVTFILFTPVKGLVNMVAARHATDSDSGPIERAASGAVRIFL